MESPQMEQRNVERSRGRGSGRGRGVSRELGTERGGFRGGRGFGERGFRGGRGFGERGFRGGRGFGERGFRGGRGFGERGFRGGRGFGERGFRGGRGFGEGGFRGGRGVRGVRGFGGERGSRGREFGDKKGFRDGRWEFEVGWVRGDPRETHGRPPPSSLVRGEYKEHPDYPGWSADELFWILEEKLIHMDDYGFDWSRISKLIPNRSPEDCADLWKNMCNSVGPLTFKTAIDSMKSSLCVGIRRGNLKDSENFPRPTNIINHFGQKENITEKPYGEVRAKWHHLSNSKKAEYFKSQSDLLSEYYQACFDYFKENPEEFDKLKTSNLPATNCLRTLLDKMI